MMNYFGEVKDQGTIRSHPWSKSEYNPDWKYYDFRNNPELIKTSLDDFKPWEHHQAIQDFYEFLEWLNGNESNFESNDSRFRGPTPNEQRNLADKNLLFHGGMMVLFRNLQLNISLDSRQWYLRNLGSPVDNGLYQPNENMQWFGNRSIQLFNKINLGFNLACLTVHLFPCLFETAEGEKADQLGFQPAFEWWAWGDDENEALDSFGIVVNTLSQTLKTMSSEVK